MLSVVLAALLGVVSARPQLLPAGVSAAACPNYPFCGAAAPADFPVPVVQGQAVAPVLNTVPAQTAAHEQHLLINQQQKLATSPAHFPVTVIDGQNVAPGKY